MVEQVKKDLLEMFSDLRFDETRHLYYVNGENYPSVSKKLEDHYEKFNKELWLQRCAPKEGIPVWELEQRWDNKRDIACDMGHDTHDFLEHYGLSYKFLADTPQKRAGVKFFNDYIDCNNPRYTVICRELRMIHRTFKYCGTSDLILWDNIEQCIVIADWKTNEDLFKTYGYLKAPFNNFSCNPFNKYQLQFSYYQLMLMQSKYRIGSRQLVYLDSEENYTIYPCTDLTKTLTEYLTNPNQFTSTPASYGMVW
jgi:hypothetical protein